MMASRILSRFLPTTDDDGYHDGGGGGHVPRTADRLERGLADSTDDHELDALLAEAEAEMERPQPSSSRPHGGAGGDDDIPASLLIEARPASIHRPARPPHSPPQSERPRADSQWRKAQEKQQLHPEDRPRPVIHNTPQQDAAILKEQAVWMWTNVQNLDAFLLEIYEYFTSHGIYSILLSRFLQLATTAFLFTLFIFLSTCVDYAKIPTSKATSEVLIPQCMKKSSWFKGLLIWVFCFWWLWTLCKYVVDIPRLRKMEMFYQHLLGIPDTDIQAVSWERVVQGLMKLRDLNPETADTLPKMVKNARKQSKQRMDAHDIANRLMRRDNYSIALFNKEIFDLTLSVPFLGNRQYYSKSLDDCIKFCFAGFIFNDQGHVNPACLQRRDRHRLIQLLRTRLRFVAIMSIFLAPYTVFIHCVYYFSRYYAEFRASPSSIGTRTFTPLAEWKFREFNELEHDFRYRMKQAHPYAAAYLEQFPRDKTHQFLEFVSLVSGTLAGLLGVATLWDPELFLGFEITSGRTAFFYITVLLAIATGARNAIPDETKVHEPIFHLTNVIQATHYYPARWKNQLHSDEVRVEFSALYQMKVLIFLEELMSLLIAPFILWRNSGKRSEMIVDFFRNSTVQVDGLGHLCTFAVFEFRKAKNVEDDVAADIDGLREEYFGTKDDKMARSQYYFMERLGRYDQQQAARLNRPYGMQLPPAFPPLSPLKKAAAAAGGRTDPRRAAPSHLPSPHQSLLLDVPHHQKANTYAPSARRPKGKANALRPTNNNNNNMNNRRTPNANDYMSPDEGEEDRAAAAAAAIDATMTTSKLIEQDSSLADSWKFSDSQDEDVAQEQGGIYGGGGGGGGGGGVGGNGNGNNANVEQQQQQRAGNGVLGLLVEYSKAHAGGKGPKIG